MKTFREFLSQKGKIAEEELEIFFASLESVTIKEMIDEWKGGYFNTGKSKLEFFLKDFWIIKWHGKIFLSKDNVQSLVFSLFGIKFNIPVAGVAVLRKMEFRNKISASMIYSYLPIIDNFRKIDNETVMGAMEVKGKVKIYFYLTRE